MKLLGFLLFVFLIAISVHAAPPPNDNFTNAIPLSGVSVTAFGTTVGATQEPGEPTPPSNGTNSIWWSWTAPADGFTRVSTIGSQGTLDTVLWVFRGAALTNLSLVASNDDSGGNNKSLALFTATNGVTYMIRVRGFTATQSGYVVLNLHMTNTAPTAIITNPVDSATFPAGSSVTINAWSSDFGSTSLGNSSVTNVEFFDGAIKLGQDTGSPFSFPWAGAGLGSHVLTAVAKNNKGLSTTSAPVNVTVNPNQLPTVSVTAPTNGASFNGPINVTVSANASDPDGGIARVEFFANGTSLGQDTSSPYSVTWSASTQGSFTLTAVATDTSSANTTSAPVTVGVSVNLAPEVFIRAPTNNASFTAAPNLTLVAQATDGDGTISKVEFYRGATLMGQAASIGNNDYSLVWSNVAAGAYNLTAVATDNIGNATTSAVTVVTITALGANQTNLIPAGSIWKYLDTGIDPGAGWSGTNFNDNSWLSGAAQLGYGDGDEATTLSFGPDPNNKYITTWFRRAFVVSNAFQVTNLVAHVLRDDGVVIYLNGQELWRDANMPVGAVTSSTVALGAINGNEESITFLNSGNLPTTALVSGTNILATEIHQANGTSSDISFDLELIADLGPGTNVFPTVSITAPTNNAFRTLPVNLVINANASDANGSVALVEFFETPSGGSPIKLGEDSTSPYSFTWTNPPPGLYALTAVATDNLGATNTSAAINISISNNVAPAVALTAPTNNALFAAPATITLTATATDIGGGTISKVEFFEGANKLGEDVTSPYSFSWTNVPAGTYQLTAIATDNGGLISTSSVVNVTVVNNQTPVVTIASPTNGATFTTPTNITIVSSPTDDGVITRVEFFQNNTKIGERTAVPYSLTWSNVGVGLYSLTAVATDNFGARGTSAPVTITVQSSSSSSWVAFNDHAPGAFTHSNATTWNALGDPPGSSGALKNITNGTTLPVTLTITRSGAVAAGGTADYPTSGTPAYNTFNGFVDLVGNQNPAVQIPAGALVTYTFTGLDPAKRYSFKGSAVRGGVGSNYTNRWTVVELLGASSFTSTHTPNAVTSAQAPVDLTASQAAFNFGVNFSGDMADWENIDPGSDGTFAVTCTQYFGFVPGGSSTANAPPYGYGISAIRLEEINTSAQFFATITSPGSNSTFFIPTDIKIDASAVRIPGSITKVEFFQNPLGSGTLTKLGEDSTAPYSLTWSNVPAGNYGLRVVATDNTSATVTSSVVNISVISNSLPTVAITSPTNNSTFTGPVDIQIDATASDPGGSISKVEFYQGTLKLGEDASSPYSFLWQGVGGGNYQLRAVAIDSLGGATTSAVVNVTVTGTDSPTLIATGSVWKYLDTGTNLGTAWVARNFNDTSWLSGPAQLGYGDGDEATVVSFGPNAANKYVTTYFRHSFVVNNPANFLFLTIRLLRDDGGIVYLNGTEVFRSNIGPGPVLYDMFANNATDDGAVFQVTNGVPANLLVSGTNVVAVEMHQATPGSTDISFELELIGNNSNSRPTVAINSPFESATFTEPANVNITASASDSDGSVTKVEFYEGNNKLGEVGSAPYTFPWTSVPVGTYHLRAVATDNFDARGTSAPVTIFVTGSTAPTIAEVIPQPGIVSNLTQITVSFSEPVDGVDVADLLINGVAATSLSGSNAVYTFSFPQPGEGTVSITWAAQHGIADRESTPKPFDALAQGATWQYQFLDTVPPSLASISPVPGATIRSLDEIKLTFSEAVTGVDSDDLLINGQPTKSVKGAGAGVYTFDFIQPSNGVVTISWDTNHFIHDFAAAENSFIPVTWTYVLNTNLVTDVVINEIMYHPSSHLAAEAYVELLNRGSNAVNVTGWEFTSGISFLFPNRTIPAGGYLVVAADLAAFSAKYPTVSNVIGSLEGALSHSSEEITLRDALGDRVDSVDYADEGDWALRRRSVIWNQGWDWVTDHDGLGPSLELMNPGLPNQYGYNWAASSVANGTPGRVNSIFNTNIAPIIADVGHFPIVPRSTNSVTITARVIDERSTGVTVTLFYRLGSGAFTSAPMLDNGLNGDGLSGDFVFGAIISPRTNLAVVEFYVQAADSSSNTRTWPGPTDGSGTQGANALYQVDNENYTGSQPIYRVIMTEAERALIDSINASNPTRNDQMNATLITINGVDTKVRYRCGIRLRGAGSRGVVPPNFQAHIPSDNRWNGVKEINLNTQNTHSQTIGSILARKCGLTSEECFPIQCRVNGVNRAAGGSPQFSSYVHLEVLDADFAENHFPYDPNGNVYRCSRPSSDLAYRGTDPNSYISAGYSKESNAAENDWTDLQNLTFTLNNTSDPDYANSVRRVANVEEWVRYFAVLAMLGYNETSIGSNGDPDDYSMYRGAVDTRFRIFAHDHDSDLGVAGGSTTALIFRATANPVVNIFLKRPEFAPLYYKELKRICDTVFRSQEVNPLIEEALSSWAGTAVPAMEDFAANRRTYVLSQIPLALTVTNTLPIANGYYSSASSTLSLNGGANVIETRSIKVNGLTANWSAWQGTWNISGVPLQRGVNRIVIAAFDAAGNEIARQTQDVLYDQPPVSVSGTIAGNQTWTAAGGPYLVTASISIPSSATLTLQPGTTVYFAAGTTMTVSGTGRLLAQGTDAAHIRFTRQLGGGNWGSLDFLNSSVESRLAYVDFEFVGGTSIGGHDAQVHANNSIVFFDHLTFPSTPVVQYISFDNSSFVVQNSTFPSYPGPTGPEMLHGVNGIPASGYGIFRDNYFGHTWGFNDTIDFTGGNRPSAILQVLGNVFDGASDDHLDLDSTDAWIEGNIFMHAHRDPASSASPLDTSSAISGGVDTVGQNPDWTIINNIFYDVDHVFLNKGGSTTTGDGGGRVAFLYNTVIHVAKEYSGSTAAEIAAFNWSDDNIALPDPSLGSGLYAAHNIIYDCTTLHRFYNPSNQTVIMDNNILSVPWSGPGSGNQVVDPMLNLAALGNTAPTNVTVAQLRQAARLLPGSPAIGVGFGGLNLGGFQPHGIVVAGEPPATTPNRTATLTVGPGGTFNWGSTTPQRWGWTAFRWKLDGGPYSAEIPVTNNPPFTNLPTITLSNLGNGPHTVFISGRNDAGSYQDDPFVYSPTSGIPARVTASRTWVVNTNLPRVRINELLARNVTAVPVGSKFPDLVELYNSGPSAVDLSGMGLTDERSEPFKFTFPPGTSIGSGQYLLLYADNENTPPGIHLGFPLDGDGDDLSLYGSTGQLLDSVSFGLQVPDLSIGRLADGSWALTRPTFGSANIIQRTGDPMALKINEWLADGFTVSANDFIELYNPGALPVSLGGMFLTDNPIGAPDLSEIVPLSFIAAHGFAVFTADGDPEQGADHVNFSLAPEMGMIGLSLADLTLVDCIVYGPQTTDISQGRSPNGAATTAFFGTPTPGSPNPAPFVPGGNQIVLSEILANNINIQELDGSTPDWVELYNPATNAVDLADMSLSDTAGNARRFVFPVGSIVGARSYYVVRCDPDLPVTSTNTGFGIKATGGAVFLFDKLANGGSLVSSVSYGIQAPDFSIGTTNGGTNWFLTIPTPRAANNLAALGNPALVKVNEWMPVPASGDDWFELYNPNSQPVALGGLWLTDDTGTPKKSQIPSLSYLGIGLYGFQRFWADNNVPAGADHVSFRLNNSGEAVGLSTFDGALIDAATFGTLPAGVSEGRLPDGTATIVQFPNSPTPGESNFLPLDNVVINEALTHTDDPFEDAIELHNLSGVQIDIGGWYLSDAKHFLKKFRIPNNTRIDPNGFIVFYENQFNPVPGTATSFSLNSAKGDELYLSAATLGGTLTGYRSQVKFGAGENGVSFGRYQTSVGLEFVAMAQHTFGVDGPDTLAQFRTGTGTNNTYPKVGPIVISEIMYHPPDINGNDDVLDEFIELRNITTDVVPLYHLNYPANTWRLRDAVSFDFPPGVTMFPGNYLLVVSFDPTNALALSAFRAYYNIDASVPVYGPYSGKLDNSSDKVELYKPDAPQQPPDPDAGYVPYILVDRVVYSDVTPWPATADGTGMSLQRVVDSNFGNDPVNWTAAAPTPGPAASNDRDQDGMPDQWEVNNGLNPDDDSDASEDADHDGLTNLNEYRAGTNPQDPLSNLNLQIVSINPIVLRFTAQANKSYTIERRDTLNSGPAWTRLINIAAQPNSSVIQITDGSANASRFYRLRTPQLP